MRRPHSDNTITQTPWSIAQYEYDRRWGKTLSRRRAYQNRITIHDPKRYAEVVAFNKANGIGREFMGFRGPKWLKLHKRSKLKGLLT